MNTNSRKTKILATLGPKTSTVEEIKNLMEAGVNAVRLNMSHGSYDFYSTLFENIHTARTELNSSLAILADIQGPKIRIGELSEPQIEIFAGNEIEITTDEVSGNDKFISTS